MATISEFLTIALLLKTVQGVLNPALATAAHTVDIIDTVGVCVVRINVSFARRDKTDKLLNIRRKVRPKRSDRSLASLDYLGPFEGHFGCSFFVLFRKLWYGSFFDRV